MPQNFDERQLIDTLLSSINTKIIYFYYFHDKNHMGCAHI